MRAMHALVAAAVLSAATAHGAATVSVSSFTHATGTGYRFNVDSIVPLSYDTIIVDIDALPSTQFLTFTPGTNATTTNRRTGVAGGNGSVLTDVNGDPTGFTVLGNNPGGLPTSVTASTVTFSAASLGADPAGNAISGDDFDPMTIAQVFIGNGFDFGGSYSFRFLNNGFDLSAPVVGTFGNVPPPVVPEPSTGLVVLGLAALAGAARRANLIG